MKVYKQIYLSLINNLKRTLLLFISTLFIASFASASFSIYQTADTLGHIMKESLGASVYLGADMTANMTVSTLLPAYEEVMQAQKAIEEAKSLLNDERVAYGDIYQTLGQGPIHDYYLIDENEELSNYSTVFCSVTQSPLIDVQAENIEMIAGHEFSSADFSSNANSIIVSDQLVHEDKSPIKIGEKLRFTFPITRLNQQTLEAEIVYEATFEYEVVGIYKNIITKETTKTDREFWLQNYIYIPYPVLKNTSEQLRNLYIEYGEAGMESIADIKLLNGYFKLNDPDDLEAFMLDFNHYIQDYETLYLVSDLEDYYAVSEPINRMKMISLLTVIIAITFAIILLSLIIYDTVKSKKKEIGLYLSLGKKKNHIFLQIFCEIWLVCLIGLSGSIFVGHAVGQKISSQVIHDIASQQENSTQEEIKEDYHFTLETSYIILVFIDGSLVILVSSLYPMKKMMRYSPKELLS